MRYNAERGLSSFSKEMRACLLFSVCCCAGLPPLSLLAIGGACGGAPGKCASTVPQGRLQVAHHAIEPGLLETATLMKEFCLPRHMAIKASIPKCADWRSQMVTWKSTADASGAASPGGSSCYDCNNGQLESEIVLFG